MQNLLVVLEAGRAYPSGCVRGLAYQDLFKEAGVRVRYINRQSENIASLLASPPAWMSRFMCRVLAGILHGFDAVCTGVRERWIVVQARRVEVVYLCKVASLRLVRRLKAGTMAKVVMDFGDAQGVPSSRLQELEEAMRMADHVTVHNIAAAQYVIPFNPRVTLVPDSPHIESFDRVRTRYPKAMSPLVIGWIGSPETLHNLFVVWEALEKIFTKYPQLHLRLVGTGHEARFLPPFEKVRYSCKPLYTHDEMVQEVLGMHIGLFPLQRVQASEMRGVLNGMVYMAGGAAVVASPTGQIPAFIKDNMNGLLAEDTHQWTLALDRLIKDEGLRHRIAESGLQLVRERCTTQASFDVLLNTLRKVSP